MKASKIENKERGFMMAEIGSEVAIKDIGGDRRYLRVYNFNPTSPLRSNPLNLILHDDLCSPRSSNS